MVETRAPRNRLGLIVLVLGVTAAVVMIFGPWAPTTSRHTDELSSAASVWAAWCCLSHARRSCGPDARCWALFGVAMSTWTAANLLWLVNALTGGQVLLRVADGFYLVGLIPLTLALLVFPLGAWEPYAAPRLALDAIVLGSGLLLLSHVLALHEVVAKAPSSEILIATAYPVADVLMTGLCLLLLLRSAGRPRRDLVLLAVAFALWTYADNGFALLQVRSVDYTRTWVAVAFIAAALTLGLAALSAPRGSTRIAVVRRDPTAAVASVLPDVLVVVTAVVCVVTGLEGRIEWGLAVLTFALTGLRQLTLTAHNHILRRSLEQRVAHRTDELRVLAQRHGHILDSVGEGILEIDPDGRITYVNALGVQLLGWTPLELEGRLACATLCPDGDEECPMSLVRALGTPVTQAETRFLQADGGDLPVEVTVAPQVAGDRFGGVVVAFRDVTERQVVEAMKTEFVTAVSHELRTPLTAIHGSLEMLADESVWDLPETARGVIAMAQRGSQRLTRLVNDIIDVERLASGHFRVVAAPHRVAPVVAQAVAGLAPLASAAGVEVEVEHVAGLALFDPDRVQQAVVNLVGNAIKFSPPGSTVQVGGRLEGHEVVVTVTDHGRGIPPEEQKAVFERFHQVAVSDARDQGGTGLGLPITRAIVERHGGQLWVESEVGVGSRFSFSLPRVEEAQLVGTWGAIGLGALGTGADGGAGTESDVPTPSTPSD